MLFIAPETSEISIGITFSVTNGSLCSGSPLNKERRSAEICLGTPPCSVIILLAPASVSLQIAYKICSGVVIDPLNLSAKYIALSKILFALTATAILCLSPYCGIDLAMYSGVIPKPLKIS